MAVDACGGVVVEVWCGDSGVVVGYSSTLSRVHTVKLCPTSTACTSNTRRKIPVLPSPSVKAELSLYLAPVDAGVIITRY